MHKRIRCRRDKIKKNCPPTSCVFTLLKLKILLLQVKSSVALTPLDLMIAKIFYITCKLKHDIICVK